jgi:hypothetical protein
MIDRIKLKRTSLAFLLANVLFWTFCAAQKSSSNIPGAAKFCA